MLAKYDEVIDSDKNIAKNTFTIGEKIEKRNTIDSVKAKLNNKRLESLNLPELKLASEYFTPEEIAFKKPKKKVRKIRQKPKMLKADDLLAMDNSSEYHIYAMCSYYPFLRSINRLMILRNNI